MTFYTVTVFQNGSGKWRWRQQSMNNRVVGASTEGYGSRQAALDNLAVVTGWNLSEEGKPKPGRLSFKVARI